MRKIDMLLNEYGESHQNATNKKIHFLAVPLIYLTVFGLLWQIPMPFSGFAAQQINWPLLLCVPVLAFYFSLSFAIGVGMTIYSAFVVLFLRFGIATPTEVAVLSTLYAGVVSVVVYRDLSFKRLNDAVVSAGLATGVVLLVIMASAAIGWLLTYDQMPTGVAHWIQQNVSQGWIVILIMNLLMLFIGMFIDLPAAVLLLTPVFLPLAASIGMDPVQLGIMMVVNLAVGLYTPPVGTTLFITSALAKVKVGQTVRELGPFYFVAFLVLALVSYVPASILR